MAEYVLFAVRDAEEFLAALPEVGLTGERLPDDPDVGQIVKIVPTDLEDAESIQFELGWYADRLGIIRSVVVTEPDEPHAAPTTERLFD